MQEDLREKFNSWNVKKQELDGTDFNRVKQKLERLFEFLH